MSDPLPLSREALARLHHLLEEERASTARRLASLERTFDELVAAADLEPPDDEHDPDGTTAYERSQVSSLAAEARSRLVQLDRAMTTMAAGRYGWCTSCGQAIGAARLESVPGTEHCVVCASGRTTAW